MLISKNISFHIGKKAILHQCSMEVKPGRFTAIIGPNGAGKSSLLKALAKELPFEQGEVLLNGQNLKGIDTTDLSKMRAVMPQHTHISFPYNIEQIIEVGRFAHKSSKQENDAVIDAVIKHNQLGSYRKRIYQTLSGGEQQRVQLARIMAQVWGKTTYPKYLLLDEPTSDLDIHHQHGLLNTAKNLCQQNMGIVAVLHDLNLAAQYADDIVLMKNGKIIHQGLCNEVLTKENIEKVFDHPVEIFTEPKTGKQVIISIPKTFTEEPLKQTNYA
ncbi:heme ABC transporter ATP-binding protein [Roseivirga sp.]|uniref:heme ABC transporter ATP-binding protein n=1 Tax=Roseivirga sp. TaxID=1964215 RepID=UPI003B518F4E